MRDHRLPFLAGLVALVMLVVPASAADQSVSVVNVAFTPETVTINPGDQVTWTWDSGNHSVISDPGQSESFNSGTHVKPHTFAHSFSTPGRYEYYCSVHSTPDGTAQNGTVVVTDGTPPSASFTVSPNPASTGQSVTFDGAASSDASGIARYQWDLDGDGTFETDTATAAGVARTYASAATLTVTLRVTDTFGATNQTSQTLTISEETAGGGTGGGGTGSTGGTGGTGSTGGTGGTGGTQSPGAAGLTLAPETRTITFGSTARLAGRYLGQPPSGIGIALQQSPFPFTDPFAQIVTATTGSDGSFAFRVTARRTTRYRAVTSTDPIALSATALVAVRPRLTLRVTNPTRAAGVRARLVGTLAPAHTGKRVVLERRTGDGRYREVARPRLRRAGAKSTFEARIRVARRTNFRARFVADGDHVRATSPTVRVRAR